jgi:hypothetical protein
MEDKEGEEIKSNKERGEEKKEIGRENKGKENE